MKKTILILHGWGVDGSKYFKLKQLLENLGFAVFIPDLPGFGKQKLLKKAMNVDDYCDFVEDFVKRWKLDRLILIGHSNGGRIAIKLASRNPSFILKLILTGASGIKPRLSFKKRLAYSLSKIGKPIAHPFFRKLLYFWINEWDYYKAGELSETFKKIIAEDLTSYLPKIEIPTLLVWGEDDKVIPLFYAKKMQQLIPNAKLIVLEGLSHKLPYESPQRFVESIKLFI